MQKTYKRPEFRTFTLDREITLLMMTGNTGGEIPGDPNFNKGEHEKDTPFQSPFED